MATDAKNSYESWSLIEIMGHQRLAGYVTEANIAGTVMLRVDVPEVDGVAAFTTFLGSSSLYRITPVSEDVARRYAAKLRKMPLQPYELAALPSPTHQDDSELEDEIYDDLNDDE